MKGVKEVAAIGLAILLLTMVLTIVAMPTYVVVADKKKEEPKTEGDNGDKGPSEPSKEETGGTAPTGDENNKKDGDGIARIDLPPQGDFKQGVPGNEDPTKGPIGGGPGIPGDDHRPGDGKPGPMPIKKPPIVVINEIIKIYKTYKTVHHTDKTDTKYTMTPEQWQIMKLVWTAGIKRGQYPEVDKIMDECFGIKA